MKIIQVEMYEAADGTRWPTERECRAHETDSLPSRLTMASKTLIEAAMRYDSSVDGALDVAYDLEQAGRICGEARRAAGVVKRKKKGKDDAPEANQGSGERGAGQAAEEPDAEDGGGAEPSDSAVAREAALV